MSKRLIMTLLLTFIAVASLTTYFVSQQLEGQDIVNGRKIEPSRPLQEFSLQEAGVQEPFTRSDLLGHWTILAFGFTNCPDVCPTTLAYFRDEIQLLDKDQKKTQFVFVSVDPQRDTAAKLQKYVRTFHPAIRAVTGETEELKRFVKMFGAYFDYPQGKSGEYYEVAHTPYLFLISPKGQWQALYTQPLGRGKVAMDLTRLINS